MTLNDLFNSLYSSTSGVDISLTAFVSGIIGALFIGLLLSLTYTYKAKYTKSFVVTLALLPAVVSMVILMVNGNIGAGVAVAGTFSLVRFRSVPGTAKEIGAIFMAMSAGLATGMGYIGYALLFTIILGLASVLLTASSLGDESELARTLKITVPEDVAYTEAFHEIFEQYLSNVKCIGVKTTNMGSLYRLSYDIELKNALIERDFIDALRCRNGNLEITISRADAWVTEL